MEIWKDVIGYEGLYQVIPTPHFGVILCKMAYRQMEKKYEK